MPNDVVHENQPGGGYPHWEPSLNRQIWRLEFTPPHNNPFTPGGWQKVIENWGEVGIDISEVPPIAEQITPPWPEPIPPGSLPYPTTPPPVMGGDDDVVPPPLSQPVNGGTGIGMIAGIAILALILGGIK